MEAKYTPGPWRLLDDAGHPANIRIGSTRRPHVAKVYAESLDRDPTCEANARLIAAAPALVEALKGLWPDNLRSVPDHLTDDFVFPIDVTAGELRRAEAALSQALGGE